MRAMASNDGAASSVGVTPRPAAPDAHATSPPKATRTRTRALPPARRTPRRYPREVPTRKRPMLRATKSFSRMPSHRRRPVALAVFLIAVGTPALAAADEQAEARAL